MLYIQDLINITINSFNKRKKHVHISSHHGFSILPQELHIFIKKSLKIPKGGNQNPYIEEEQITQWSKEKVQKYQQRSTKHIYKTKDRVTRTPLKTGVNSGAPEG